MESVPVLTGPTAVGKTGIAIQVAQALGAEIVSADSRQCYRELIIGTDRPDAEDQRGVPHHFIADRSLRQPISAGVWAREASARIAEIHARSRDALVVGGSTLYLQALVHGMPDIPEVPHGIREALNRRLQVEGSEPLHAELVRVDPIFAASLDATKSQRIIRGLEVYEATGRPLSSFFDQVPPPPFQFRVLVLTRSRERLYERINSRVDRMVQRGLVNEVSSLMESGFDPEQNPLRTIGYSEIGAHLRGEATLEEAVALIKQNSRRYAKRQLTWFRRMPDTLWLDLDATERPVENVLAALRD